MGRSSSELGYRLVMASRSKRSRVSRARASIARLARRAAPRPSAPPSVRGSDARQLHLLGEIASRQIATTGSVSSLADVEFRVSSQWGEDGIIEWLCQQLPAIERSFVEFGVEDYTEANTRFLAEHRGWRGLVLDGDEDHVSRIRAQDVWWMRDLTAVAAFVTRDNINDLIRSAGFEGPIGLLSIDIDGNDYWVLEAIRVVEPAIVVCEYNGLFGPTRAVTVPYDSAFVRHEAHYSGQYYGASIQAFRRLLESRGYRFLGTNSAGVNAFFVHDRVAADILPLIESPVIWPTTHSDTRDEHGTLTALRGEARSRLIEDLPVVDLVSDSVQPLGTMLGESGA